MSTRIRAAGGHRNLEKGPEHRDKRLSKERIVLQSTVMLAAVLTAVSLCLGAGPAEAPGRVYVGLYLADVSELEVKQGRFKADLEVWQKWRGAQKPPELLFLNGEIESKDELSTESDGDWRSVRWRVQGSFRGTFPLHDYPFDSQRISIDLALPEAAGTLVADLAGSGLAEQFSITGWTYEPFFKAETRRKKVSSDFGSIATEGEPRRQSELSFVVELSRPRLAYALKFLVPLGVILAMALLALVLPGERIDVRAGVGVTALLSCVAFQFAAAEDVPNVSYLVIADKLFLLSYVLNLTTMVQSVLAFMLWDRRPRLSRRLDLAMIVLISGVAIIGFARLLRPRDRAAEENLATLTAPPSRPTTVRPVLRVGVVELSSLLGQNIPSLLHRGLLQKDDQGEWRPFLATHLPSMTNEWVRFLPGGGMSIRWNLKPGLKFSDGSPLTAEDVAASVARNANVTRIRSEALSPTLYVLEYSDRAPNNIGNLIVYPSEAVARFADVDGGSRLFAEGLRTAPPPGDGPYFVESFEVGKALTLRVNPHFAGRPPAFETVEFHLRQDSAALAQALARGEVDIAPRINHDALQPVAAAHPNLITWQLPGDDLSALIPDLSSAPFKDARARHALMLSLDREALSTLLNGPGSDSVPLTFRLSTAPDFEPGVRRWPRDPAAARKLLIEAGHSLPFEVKIFSLDAKAGRPLEYRKMLESQLAEGGFKVKWEFYSGPVPPEIARGTHGGLRLGSLATGSLRRVFNRRSEGAAWSRAPDGVNDEAIIKDLDRHATTLFEERRDVISRRLQKEFAERLPIIPIAYFQFQGGQTRELQGVKPPRADVPIYWNVEDWYLGPPPPAIDGGSP